MTDNKQDWSYAAGIVDGEGYVGITKDTRREGPDKRYVYPHYGMQVSVTNTSLALVKWLVAKFGGVYYTRAPGGTPSAQVFWKTCYTWKPKGRKNLETFLLGVMPYLIVKREQAKLALEFIRIGAEIAPEKREELRLKMAPLNQRGKSVTTNTPNTNLSVMIESDLTGDRECASPVMANA